MRPQILDQDSIAAGKWVALRAIRCSDWLYRAGGKLLWRWYEPSVDLWMDGMAIYEDRGQKRGAGEFSLGCLCHT